MDTRSRHVLAEFHGCDRAILNDTARIEALMTLAAKAANVTIVQSVFHRYAPQGVSGVVIIEESHLSIHTWPEHDFAAVDFFTCGSGTPERAVDVLKHGLSAQRTEVMLVERGTYPPGPSMRVRSHYAESADEERSAIDSRED
jgi:S-adenosylmethionine decarboxylase proenzyme